MKKVFITDDSQLYIDTLSAILSSDEVLICSTTSANEAIDKILSFMPDVIIIDKIMVEKDGEELVKEIKADSRISYIPTLLISGDDISDVIRTNGDLDDYIRKTEDANEIRRRVRIFANIGITRKAARGKLE